MESGYFPLTSGMLFKSQPNAHWPRQNIFRMKPLSGIKLYFHFISQLKKHNEITIRKLYQHCGRLTMLPLFEKFAENFVENIEGFIHTQQYKTYSEDMVPPHEVIETIKSFALKVLPTELFGVLHNKYRFLDIIGKIVTSREYDCSYNAFLIHRLRLHKIPYISSVRNMKERKLLMIQIMSWILTNFLKPLIRTVYYLTTCSGNIMNLHFIKHYNWETWSRRIFNAMILQRDLVEVPLDINIKTLIIMYKGELRLLPKNGALKKHRTLVIQKSVAHRNSRIKSWLRISDIPEDPFNFNKRSILKSEKALLTELIKIEKVSHTGDLYDPWKEFLLKCGNRPIYGATADIRDAYGSVDIDKLEEELRRRLNLLRINKNVSLLRRILKTIRSQIVSVFWHKKQNVNDTGVKFYYWKRGLLQGTPLSGPLCEIYRSAFDVKHFKNLTKEPFLLHRTTDDYMFVSVDQEAVRRFISILSKNAILKEGIKSTLPEYNEHQLVYCRKIFDLRCYQILYKPMDSLEVYGRYMLWNYNSQISDPHKFVRNTFALKRNASVMNKLFVNNELNTDETISINFANIMLTIALKFEYAIRCAVADFDFAAVWANIIKFVNKYAKFGALRVGDTSVSIICDFKLIIYQVLDFVFYKHHSYAYHRLRKKLLFWFKHNRINNSKSKFYITHNFFKYKQGIVRFDDSLPENPLFKEKY